MMGGYGMAVGIHRERYERERERLCKNVRPRLSDNYLEPLF